MKGEKTPYRSLHRGMSFYSLFYRSLCDVIDEEKQEEEEKKVSLGKRESTSYLA